MKQVIAVVKPFLAEALLGELGRQGFHDITIREVRGYGRQKSYLSEYRENDYSVMFLAKIEICVWANDEDVAAVTDTIVRLCRTGRMGDGKVFCVNILESFGGF